MTAVLDQYSPQQVAALLRRASEEEREALLPVVEAELEARKYDWSRHARPEQLAPTGDWLVWLILAGRGFGKTRTGAEWAKDKLRATPGIRLAVLAPTTADARDTCIEGDSGLISVLPPSEIKSWNRSMGELVMANGSRVKCFSADEPERLRGPQHHYAWCFIAGTMIQTPDGEVPIESLEVGDSVMTRKGPKPVEANSVRSAALVRMVHEHGELVGTADHPVMTQSGWKALGDLTNSDRLYLWNDDGAKTRLATSTATKTGASSTAIESFGKTITGLSQKACTCTTSTMSRATTKSRTCNWCRLKRTASTMLKNVEKRSAESAAAPSSVALKASRRGTASRANHESANGNAGWKSGSVSTVARPSSPGEGTSVVSAVSTLEHVGFVYNLQVAETPEYFANGVLVHNCDELAAYRYPEAWDQLMFGLRLGHAPQVVATTTPRPTKLIRDLATRVGVHVTKGSTFDNAKNLAPAALAELKARYEGTRLGRQELEAEILTDVPGALATLDLLDAGRRTTFDDLLRTVVSVDPAVTATLESDETGIAVVSRGADGDCYLLDDLSCRVSPDDWARRAVKAAVEYAAGTILYEENQGADAIGLVLKQALRELGVTDVTVKGVRASKSKFDRALPLQQWIEQGRFHLVGSFPEVEEQMTTWTVDSPKSPDRLDAVVHGFTELMLAPERPRAYFRG